jgi:hypothetical protein
VTLWQIAACLAVVAVIAVGLVAIDRTLTRDLEDDAR